ncbi:MAG TPA: AAA family ATPase [Pyrinomonadaceae bacterium]|nr:AAA family ATPase [Pyrinomonadaceae bacterium]
MDRETINTQTVPLDPDQKSPRAQEFEEKLAARIVGQERAVRRMSGLYQIFLAGMNPPHRPVGTMLFLGPTGSGKTRVVEAAAEVLFGDPNAVIKIDCAEFQHSHEIAKLIGSPPGYLGHRETSPMLTQENLDRYHNEESKLSLVLFDEIEKASDSLWQLLLGILDKATLTLGDNRRVDFSKTMVIMTSNLGAREMSELISGGIGFAPVKEGKNPNDSEVDQKIYRTAVEAAAEVLFGDPNAVIKVDCAEFQHSHEIAKLIGSPPGYLGHRETSPMLTQENLDRYHTEEIKLSLVLFDEIEKASDSLWQLLLGILDKATLTLGDNRRVDFSHSMVIMTSNLGAREMSELISGGMGFVPSSGAKNPHDTEVDQKIYRTAVEAARRKFSPEFMNRIDKVVVFRSLKEHHLRQILDLELGAVQERVMRSAGTKFVFQCSDEAKELLLKEGIDFKYGARHLKRAIERFLVYPLSNLVATEQVGLGDLVYVDLSDDKKKLVFSKRSGGALISEPQDAEEQPQEAEAKSGGVALPLPQTKAARKSQSRGEKTEG